MISQCIYLFYRSCLLVIQTYYNSVLVFPGQKNPLRGQVQDLYTSWAIVVATTALSGLIEPSLSIFYETARTQARVIPPPLSSLHPFVPLLFLRLLLYCFQVLHCSALLQIGISKGSKVQLGQLSLSKYSPMSFICQMVTNRAFLQD